MPEYPCRVHGCHACCVDTRMTLTNEDVERLRRRGARGFIVWQDNGSIRLRNEKGRCVFLRHDVCSVYTDRPEGCRLYPLVLSVDGDRVVHDEFCPHAEDFHLGADAETRLRESLATEEREARERTRPRPSGSG